MLSKECTRRFPRKPISCLIYPVALSNCRFQCIPNSCLIYTVAIIKYNFIFCKTSIHFEYRVLIRYPSHLDASGGRGAQPVPVGREDERVDDVSGVKRVEALALLEVPQHGGPVLATGGAQRPVRRHGHRVQVPGVADQVRVQLAVRQGPHLHQLVPSRRDDHGSRRRRRESHARHPLRVALCVVPPKGVPRHREWGGGERCKEYNDKMKQVGVQIYLPVTLPMMFISTFISFSEGIMRKQTEQPNRRFR